MRDNQRLVRHGLKYLSERERELPSSLCDSTLSKTEDSGISDLTGQKHRGTRPTSSLSSSSARKMASATFRRDSSSVAVISVSSGPGRPSASESSLGRSTTLSISLGSTRSVTTASTVPRRIRARCFAKHSVAQVVHRLCRTRRGRPFPGPFSNTMYLDTVCSTLQGPFAAIPVARCRIRHQRPVLGWNIADVLAAPKRGVEHGAKAHRRGVARNRSLIRFRNTPSASERKCSGVVALSTRVERREDFSKKSPTRSSTSCELHRRPPPGALKRPERASLRAVATISA